MIDALQALGVNPFTSAVSTVRNHAAETAETEAMSFASVMGSMATSMADNIRKAETTSADGILGKASVREVADAVMAADQSLQTAIAFRDKVVSAYLEIIKMPI